MKLNRKQLQKLILEELGAVGPDEMEALVLKVLQDGLPDGYTVVHNEGTGYEISGPGKSGEGVADMYLNFGAP